MSHDKQFILSIAKTQADPFASPTRVRVYVPARAAAFPLEAYNTPDRARALSDYCLRAFYASCIRAGADEAQGGQGWGGPKGGDVRIAAASQHVLEQSAVRVSSDGAITAQFTVCLPARGRTILGNGAAQIFRSSVPTMVQSALFYQSHDPSHLKSHVLAIEDQAGLRRQLAHLQLVSFVANGSILPRASGAADTPLASASSVAFESPASLEVRLRLVNAGRDVAGMGLRKGVTLIVGGGYHGKSTLLNAIQSAVYDKIPGDGRELIVTDADAVKIKAEDGRQLHQVCITPFISNLPFDRDTNAFTTEDASGSTSQAATIMEALELDAKVLIFDEDTCATNFMIRDAKMAALVPSEPITPFISRVTELYENAGVSSLLVVGGCGDYLNVANTVLMMNSFKCVDATEDARKIVQDARFSSQVPPMAPSLVPSWNLPSRQVKVEKLRPDFKCSVRSLEKISYGDSIEIRLSGLEQIVCIQQTNAILAALHKISKSTLGKNGGKATIKDTVDAIDAAFDSVDLASALDHNSFAGDLARPRRYEIAGALNRLRISDLLTR